MATENENKLDYATFLADLEGKRTLLDTAISSLKAALAAGALGTTEGTSYINLAATIVKPSIHNGEVPAGAFLGKSIPEAAKLFLSIVKSKQTTREIADALLKGGMETTSANFENIVHAGLNREKKASGEIVRVGKAWALAQWYPSGIRAQGRQEKRKTKKRKTPKPKAIIVPEKAAPRPAAGTLWDRIPALLRSNPARIYTPQDIAQALAVDVTAVRMMLGRLAARKIVEEVERGKYRATHNSAA